MHCCKGDQRPKPGSRIVSNLDAFEAFDRDFNIPKASLPKVNNCRQSKLIGRICNLFNLFFFSWDTRDTRETERNWTLHLPVANWQTASEMVTRCRGCPSQLPPNVPLGKLGAFYNIHPQSSLLASQPSIRERKIKEAAVTLG